MSRSPIALNLQPLALELLGSDPIAVGWATWRADDRPGTVYTTDKWGNRITATLHDDLQWSLQSLDSEGYVVESHAGPMLPTQAVEKLADFAWTDPTMNDR